MVMDASIAKPESSQVPVANRLTVLAVLVAVFTSLVFVSTYIFFVPIPATRGIFNFGDIMIFIAALTFGPLVGGLAGGLGSALADTLAAPLYAPYTLMIKGMEGWIAGYMSKGGSRKRDLIAWLCASPVMVVGYFVVQSFFIAGVVAVAEIPFNILQVAAGGIVGVPVSRKLRGLIPASMGRM